MKSLVICEPSPLRLISLILLITQGAATQDAQGPGIVIAYPGQDVELCCGMIPDLSDLMTVAVWMINGTGFYDITSLHNGKLAGHSATLGGRNIIVENITMNDPRNASVYKCTITNDVMILYEGDPSFLYIAGVPVMVPNVTVNENIAINGDNVTLTLDWGEPFNNLDPIVNYTVSCSGDVTCPPNFTTTDNTTRSYTITNLNTMTTYIFSVVATNSIGSGEAGVVMITTLPLNTIDITATSLLRVPTTSSEGMTTTTSSVGMTTISSSEGMTTTSSSEGMTTTSSSESMTTTSSSEGMTTTSSSEGMATTSSSEGMTTTSSSEGMTIISSSKGMTTTSSSEGMTTTTLSESMTTITSSEYMTTLSSEGMTTTTSSEDMTTTTLSEGMTTAPNVGITTTTSSMGMTTAPNVGMTTITSSEDMASASSIKSTTTASSSDSMLSVVSTPRRSSVVSITTTVVISVNTSTMPLPSSRTGMSNETSNSNGMLIIIIVIVVIIIFCCGSMCFLFCCFCARKEWYSQDKNQDKYYRITKVSIFVLGIFTCGIPVLLWYLCKKCCCHKDKHREDKSTMPMSAIPSSSSKIKNPTDYELSSLDKRYVEVGIPFKTPANDEVSSVVSANAVTNGSHDDLTDPRYAVVNIDIIASHNTAGGAQQGSNKTTSTNKNDGVFAHQNAPAGAQQDSVKNQPTPQYALPIKKSDRNKDVGASANQNTHAQDSVKNQPTPQYAIPIKKSDRNKDRGVSTHENTPADAQETSVQNQPTPQYVKKSDGNKDQEVKYAEHQQLPSSGRIHTTVNDTFTPYAELY